MLPLGVKYSLLFGCFLVCCEAIEIDDIVRANGDFAFKLYEKLKGSSKNMFYSPMSISSALGMTYAGANAATKSQMENTLSFGQFGSDTAVHEAFKSLLEALDEPANNYTLDIANRIFARQGYNILPSFTQTVQNNYAAVLELLNFEEKPEESRVHINYWVEDQTNDKIKDLLPEGVITNATVMVLVNAIYFKGLWKFPFDSKRTTKKTFYLAASESVQMDMMSLVKNRFNYYEHTEWDCAILELPYEGSKASMVIILPNTKTGVGRIEDNISIDGLTTAISNMRYEALLVTIPKFKLIQTISLKAYLTLLGMEDIFDESKADLSGINGEDDLFVIEVLHKAYVDVNEEGTEAAGASGAIMWPTSVQPAPKVFLADRPFIFLLRDTTTGSILFLGRLSEPPRQGGASLGKFGATAHEILDGSRSHNLLVSCFTLIVFALISYLVSDSI